MTPDTLKAWRARLSLGEAGMAAYLGVPVTTYRKWENGTRKPDAAPLRLFAVLQRIEQYESEGTHHLHDSLLLEAQGFENRPAKARKPRAATQPPTPAAPAVGPDSGVSAPLPWAHAAQVLPDWMKSGA
jgi:transcriptional regulator with XRE-family HTH domain